jgi:hypothetical protein
MLPNKSGRGDFKSAVAPSDRARTTTASHKTRPQSMWRTIAWPLARKASAADLTLALDCLVSRLEGEWDAPPIKCPQSAQA